MTKCMCVYTGQCLLRVNVSECKEKEKKMIACFSCHLLSHPIPPIVSQISNEYCFYGCFCLFVCFFRCFSPPCHLPLPFGNKGHLIRPIILIVFRPADDRKSTGSKRKLWQAELIQHCMGFYQHLGVHSTFSQLLVLRQQQVPTSSIQREGQAQLNFCHSRQFTCTWDQPHPNGISQQCIMQCLCCVFFFNSRFPLATQRKSVNCVCVFF